MIDVRCHSCSKVHQLDATRWRCDCGGLFDLVRNARPYSEEAFARVTLGEGDTALVVVDTAEPNLMAKVEYASPTGSFKDRGAAALIAYAVDIGVERAVADSSGNAGVSVAAYCARAGIHATVFVAASTSAKKVKQLSALGAEVVAIEGTREDVAAAAQQRVEADGAFYASHVYNPVFHYGVSGLVEEVVDAVGQAPDRFLFPVGNGTLLLGARLAFERADVSAPITAVQASACAPLADAVEQGRGVSAVHNSGTVAEGIAIADPARGTQLLEWLKEIGGDLVTVDDEKVVAAKTALARLGFYVEPTAAATYAAWSAGAVSKDRTVTVLCGSGLKSD